MEARQTLRGGAVPKGLIVLLAICATVALAVAGSVVSKNLAASSATRSVIVHPAAGTVLRQDAGSAPALLDRGAEGQAAQASQAAPVGIRNGRSSGNQSIVDNAAGQAADTHGPDSDLTRALPSQSTSGNTGTGAEPPVGLSRGNRYI